MGQAFVSLFAMLASFFSAAQKVGNTANNLAGWAEDASGVFADEAKLNRDLAIIKAEKARAVLKAELMAEITVVPTAKAKSKVEQIAA